MCRNVQRRRRRKKIKSLGVLRMRNQINQSRGGAYSKQPPLRPDARRREQTKYACLHGYAPPPSGA